MRELLEWIKKYYPDQYESIRWMHLASSENPIALEEEGLEYVCKLIEKYIFEQYGFILDRKSSGIRIFWDAKGVYISGNFRFYNAAIREAFYLTNLRPVA